MATVKKKIRTIRIDADKCNGCRGCEIACSNYHAQPRYSSVNPARSRIRVITHRLQDVWLPVFAGEYARSECAGRNVYSIAGKVYDECEFCRASCPSRDWFKEPDSGLPLKCDMCEGEAVPKCVEWCLPHVLTYEEREVEVEEEPVKPEELQRGLEALADKHGMQQLKDALSRLTKSE